MSRDLESIMGARGSILHVNEFALSREDGPGIQLTVHDHEGLVYLDAKGVRKLVSILTVWLDETHPEIAREGEGETLREGIGDA